MDKEKLAKLREKYANAAGDDVFDPEFKKVADMFVYGRQSRQAVRWYSNIARRAVHREPGRRGHWVKLAYRWILASPIVMEPGSARAPCAQWSGLARITMFSMWSRASLKRVADIGDCPMRSRFSHAECMKDIEEHYRKLRDANVRPLTVGGDHSITLPIMRALGEERAARLHSYRCSLRHGRRI